MKDIDREIEQLFEIDLWPSRYTTMYERKRYLAENLLKLEGGFPSEFTSRLGLKQLKLISKSTNKILKRGKCFLASFYIKKLKDINI